MKLKFLMVFILLLVEAAYAGRMILDSNDPGVAEVMLQIPGVAEYFYEYRVAESRAKAEAGDVHEMMAYYYKAGDMGNEGDRERAVELLEHSGSATAALFLHLERTGGISDEPSREFMLLLARAMRENIRPYLPIGDSNIAYTHQSRQYARAFEILQEKARQGDPDALWVMVNLGIVLDSDKDS
jgi:TPR repeat protein